MSILGICEIDCDRTGFQLPEEKEKLREGLAVLAGRLNEQGTTQLNLQQAVKYVPLFHVKQQSESYIACKVTRRDNIVVCTAFF